jgi:hypothetical protein
MHRIATFLRWQRIERREFPFATRTIRPTFVLGFIDCGFHHGTSDDGAPASTEQREHDSQDQPDHEQGPRNVGRDTRDSDESE